MTKTADPFAPAEEAIPRDRWGRPWIIPPGGGPRVAYTRCTTFVGSIEDTYNLSRWQQRMVASGMAARPDLVMGAAALDEGSAGYKEELQRIADAAQEASQAKAKATIGTALHQFTQAADETGRIPPKIPAAYRPDVEAYVAKIKEVGLVKVAAEEFRVWDSLQVAGTADAVWYHPASETYYIGDLKTGSVEYGMAKIAMQLCVYAYGVPYVSTGPKTGVRPRASYGVSRTRGLLIHLPQGEGRCEIHSVDLTVGLRGVKLAKEVREFRKLSGLAVPFAN